METSIAHLVAILEDPEFYVRDAQAFLKTSEKLEQLRSELATAEGRWLELTAMAESA